MRSEVDRTITEHDSRSISPIGLKQSKMRPDSVKEYEFIRHELDGLKSCITTYVGFVIGGIGAAVLFGFSGAAPNAENFRAVAYTSLALALILNSVLRILMYKFHSHNRFVGYCVVIGHEHFAPGAATPVSLLTWEIALGKLRFHAVTLKSLSLEVAKLQHVEGIDTERLRDVLMYYTGKNPFSDKWRIVKGMGWLVRAIFGFSRTRSWAFPPVVVAIFFLISGALILVGIGMTVTLLAPQGAFHEETTFVSIVAAALVMYVVSWCRFLGKFHDLMAGSATTSAFAWRFLPIRTGLLIAHGFKPTFPFVHQHLEDEWRWIKKRERRTWLRLPCALRILKRCRRWKRRHR